jgi:hypothetical protein
LKRNIVKVVLRGQIARITNTEATWFGFSGCGLAGAGASDGPAGSSVSGCTGGAGLGGVVSSGACSVGFEGVAARIGDQWMGVSFHPQAPRTPTIRI